MVGLLEGEISLRMYLDISVQYVNLRVGDGTVPWHVPLYI